MEKDERNWAEGEANRPAPAGSRRTGIAWPAVNDAMDRCDAARRSNRTEEAEAARWEAISIFLDTVPKDENGLFRTRKSRAVVDDGSEWFMDLLVKTTEKYCGDQGNFEHYYNAVYSRRIRDRADDAADRRDVTELDAPVKDSPDLTVGDTIATMDRQETAARELAGLAGWEGLIKAIILYKASGGGRWESEAQAIWFRVFFTEDATAFAKDVSAQSFHERETFDAMDVDYLDYYMTRPCRTLRAIGLTPLKPYREVADVEDEEETRVPLPANVSLRYLSVTRDYTVGNSTRSNHMKKYKALKDKVLEGVYAEC